MPDTGAPWNIPYVENADLVRDWPADSLAVANAVAAGLSAAGGLVQVVTATDSTSRVTTSLTFVTGTLSASITPTAIGNTVIVIWAALAETAIAPGVEVSASFRVTQGGTAVEGAENAQLGIRAAQAASLNKILAPFTLVGLYTTVGTSSVTFETEFRRNEGTNVGLQNNSMTGRLLLAEVKV